MKRALRWLRRILLGVLALAVVAIAAALIVVHTAWGRNLIRKEIEATLLESFPGGARVGALEGSVFGTLTVSDIEISDLDHTPMVKVGSVEVQLSLWPLLLKTAHIDHLLVKDVVITKHTQTLPAPPPPPAGSMTVELPSIVVERISAVIETPQGPLTIDNGSATAAVGIMPGGFVTAVANVAGTWRERSAPITAFVGASVGDVTVIPFARAAVGGVEIVARGVRVEAMAGEIFVEATPGEITRVVPGVVVPRDLFAHVTSAARTEGGLQLGLEGTMGSTAIDGVLIADLAGPSARGIIGVHGIDIGILSKGKAQGHGSAVIAVVTDGLHARATVIASGAVILPDGKVTVNTGTGATAVGTTGKASGAIVGHVIAGIDATPQGGSVLLVGVGAGDTKLGLIGGVRRTADGGIVIERTILGMSTLDSGAASGGIAPASGAIDLVAIVEGPMSAVAVDGTAHATHVVYEDKRIGRVDARFTGTVSPGPKGTELLGHTHAEIANVVNRGKDVGSFTVDATTRRDGKIAVTGQARLAMAPIVIEASALVTPGLVIDIALGEHHIQAPEGELRGDGGTVQVSLGTIVAKGIVTVPVGAGPGARITVDATVNRLNENLVAALMVRDLPASLIDPTIRGTASADLKITRRGASWTGGGTVTAKKILLAPDLMPLDAEGKILIAGRRVSVEGHISSPTVGGARIALEVDGPRDLTDPEAWMRVGRADLHEITIGVEKLDLAALTKDQAEGTADGTLVIRGGEPSGSLAIRQVWTPAGYVDADVTLSLANVGFVDAIAKATVGAIGGADADIRLQIPDRIFDPAAWKALGTGVVNRASIHTTDVAFDTRLFAQLGVKEPFSGRANAEILVGAGGSSVDLTATVKELKGGMIKRGVDVLVTARIDDKGTAATVHAQSGELTLIDLPDARSPVTLARWIANPKAAMSSKIDGTLSIPRTPARTLLAAIGRADVEQGTIEGKVTLGGTFSAPTATATIDLLSLKVKPRLVSKPPPMLTAMHIEGSWDGTTVKVHVKADEEGKGSLVVDGSVRPADLASVAATVKIANFDVAPIVVFLPGPLMGARGKVEADLSIKGLDPALGTVTGFVHLIDGRVPISPAAGTLRAADLRIDVNSGGIDVKLDGKIGGGTVKLLVSSADLKTATLSAEVTKFSPIGAIQPIIEGRISGTFEREGFMWRGSVKVKRASILVPEQAGVALLDAAAPEDLIFVDRPIPLPKKPPMAPQRPWLIADVEIESTRVAMPEFQVVGSIAGQVRVSVGETLGLDGEVFVETATLVIAGHRYRLEIGQVAFDGTTDARIDAKLAHDFPDVTMYVQFASRVSTIDRVEPQFTSEPGIYSQGQLLGFFLGGAPGGDPSKQTAEAAAGFGASIVSSVIGKRLKKIKKIGPLLEKVEIGCKPGAGQTSAFCSAGTWVNKKTYVSFQQRINSRPDENAGEGKVEYYWKPNRTVELTGGDRGFFGVDLLWRHRW